MFDPKPPTPKALPDDQLNAKIAELQLQPDGLVAAMSFIEEQSKLRQEDALELSNWQIQAQMNAVASPNASVEESEPAPVSYEPKTAEPEIDIFASLTQDKESAVSSAPELAPSISKNQTSGQLEKIEDIVAALNASYAAAATENSEPENEVVSAQISVSESVVMDQTGLHTESEVVVELETAVQELPPKNALPVEQPSFVEENLEQDQIVTATRTSGALVWSWLAIASTPLVLVLAAILKTSGASLSQALVVVAASVVATSVLGSIGAVAAARGSASLTTISRAAFGVWGNALPAALMFVVRLLWLSALIYFAARVISPIIFNQPWFAPIAESLVFPAEFTASLFVAIPILLLASTVSGFGGQVLLRSQQATSLVSVLGTGLFIYFIAANYSIADLTQTEGIPSALLIDTALLMAAIFSFAVFACSGDFARKLPPETPSAKVFFLSFVSSLLIPLVVGLAGVLWLFMAEADLAASFQAELFASVASSTPIWIFVAFVVAIGLSMVQLVSMSLYSLAGNILGIVKMPNWSTYLVSGLLSFALFILASYAIEILTLQQLIIEALLLAAVIAASWAGVLSGDALARRRRYHEVSLTREYGFYGKFNVVNSIGFILAAVLGFGYLHGTGTISSWAGYLGDLTPEIFEVAGSNIGIALAFGFAILFPVLFGIPKIRRQERNLAELDQRREELKEFLEQVQ